MKKEIAEKMKRFYKRSFSEKTDLTKIKKDILDLLNHNIKRDEAKALDFEVEDNFDYYKGCNYKFYVITKQGTISLGKFLENKKANENSI